MRVVCVEREQSDHAQEIREWLKDFERRTGKNIEVVDVDSRDGSRFAEIYDIVEYPTFIAVADDGRVLDVWRGMPLPRIDEISYYAAEK